ncbi:MAG: hypothetical protein HZC36_14060 [Armatimonadetes bacterium]|nr:hypothetical protein [Armatimonadota bacterium]
MIAATVNWKIRDIATEDGFFLHLRELATQARDRGAELIVFPELPVLELLALRPELTGPAVGEYLAEFEEPYEDALYALAEETGAVIVGGSHVITESDGKRNACLSAYPTDARFHLGGDDYTAGDYQRKVVLTVSERDEMGLLPGAGLMPLHDRRIGVTLCYDSEFPESGRALAAAGCLVQCVPAWTETTQGFQRVRWCCKARAVENQVFVVHASIVGGLGREPIPICVGSSAILTPSAEPFPEIAVLAETPMNEEGIAIAELDFEALAECRSTGDVRNWNDRSSGDWRILRA